MTDALAPRAVWRVRSAAEAYALIAPSLLGFLLFLVAPVFGVAALSLFDWNLMGTPSFVAWTTTANWPRTPETWRSLLNTLYYVLLNVPAQTALALLPAVALNRRLPGGRALRVVFVLPWMAMPVALGIIWSWLTSRHRPDWVPVMEPSVFWRHFWLAWPLQVQMIAGVPSRPDSVPMPR